MTAEPTPEERMLRAYYRAYKLGYESNRQKANEQPPDGWSSLLKEAWRRGRFAAMTEYQNSQRIEHD